MQDTATRLPPVNAPFRWRRSGDLSFITVEDGDRFAHLTLAFSTRLGGVSTGSRGRLNLGFKGGDNPDRVRANRRLFARAVGVPLESMVTMRQVHGRCVARVGTAEAGRGSMEPGTGIEASDGLVTDSSEIGLSVSSADCVPLALFDPVNGAVAALHVGWRGFLAGIIEAGLETLAEHFGSAAAACFAFIGPAIGPCCFEVGPEVAGRFEDKLGDGRVVAPGRSDKPHVDLPLAARLALRKGGVADGSILAVGLCTSCRDGLFYSYRRDGAGTGSQMMWVRRR